jgi:hypothetical protein
MKTLVIHPKDISTDFLCIIYSNKDWTVINTNPSTKFLKDMIKTHDRIVMLGHGTELGLLGFNRFIIDSSYVYLLREKDCVCIWCNADKFVHKYDLKGFYTGMIVSDFDEALMFLNTPSSFNDVKSSNKLFAESIKSSIDSNMMYEDVKSNYIMEENPVVSFNQLNIFNRI